MIEELGCAVYLLVLYFVVIYGIAYSIKLPFYLIKRISK